MFGEVKRFIHQAVIAVEIGVPYFHFMTEIKGIGIVMPEIAGILNCHLLS